MGGLGGLRGLGSCPNCLSSFSMIPRILPDEKMVNWPVRNAIIKRLTIVNTCLVWVGKVKPGSFVEFLIRCFFAVGRTSQEGFGLKRQKSVAPHCKCFEEKWRQAKLEPALSEFQFHKQMRPCLSYACRPPLKNFSLGFRKSFHGIEVFLGGGVGGQEIICLKSKMIEKSCPLSRSKTQCLIFCFGDLWLLNQWHWCNFSLSKISNEKTISFHKNGGNVSRQQCMTEVQLSSYKKSKKVIINVGRIKVLLVRLSSHMSADCRAERCYRQTLLHLHPHPPLLLSFLWLSSRPCALHTTDWLAAPSTSGKTSATCFSLPFHLWFEETFEHLFWGVSDFLNPLAFPQSSVHCMPPFPLQQQAVKSWSRKSFSLRFLRSYFCSMLAL